MGGHLDHLWVSFALRQIDFRTPTHRGGAQ